MASSPSSRTRPPMHTSHVHFVPGSRKTRNGDCARPFEEEPMHNENQRIPTITVLPRPSAASTHRGKNNSRLKVVAISGLARAWNVPVYLLDSVCPNVTNIFRRKETFIFEISGRDIISIPEGERDVAKFSGSWLQSRRKESRPVWTSAQRRISFSCSSGHRKQEPALLLKARENFKGRLRKVLAWRAKYKVDASSVDPDDPEAETLRAEAPDDEALLSLADGTVGTSIPAVPLPTKADKLRPMENSFVQHHDKREVDMEDFYPKWAHRLYLEKRREEDQKLELERLQYGLAHGKRVK